MMMMMMMMMIMKIMMIIMTMIMIIIMTIIIIKSIRHLSMHGKMPSTKLMANLSHSRRK